MTTTPDYAAIDWVLENVPGARPEKIGTDGRRRFLARAVFTTKPGHAWWWMTSLEEKYVTEVLDESDAIAILRDWWMKWIAERYTTDFVALKDVVGFGVWEYGIVLVESSPEPPENFSQYTQHPDRTTALAMLVLRVAGKETE